MCAVHKMYLGDQRTPQLKGKKMLYILELRYICGCSTFKKGPMSYKHIINFDKLKGQVNSSILNAT